VTVSNDFCRARRIVADRGQEIEVLSHVQVVDVTKHLALGKVTIFQFYADWCGPCREVSPLLEQLAKNDPVIALRKIDIVNWQSAVAKQFDLHTIPHVNVYDRSGKLVGSVSGAYPERIQSLVAQAKRGT
jgi:thiol-disulfide isomerase/thioredoxin